MLGVLILAFLVFGISRSAKKAGKNLAFWILFALAMYIGIQIIVASSVIFVLSVGERFFDWQPVRLEKFSLPIIFFSEVFSLLGVWIIANYLKSEAENKGFEASVKKTS